MPLDWDWMFSMKLHFVLTYLWLLMVILNGRHFDTRKIRHLCDTFRHQDSSAPGQFGTCVFFFDFTYKTSNSLDSDVLISVFYISQDLLVTEYENP